MNFSFTPEQDELRATLRNLLARRSTESDVRTTMETELGFDAALWRVLGEELGVLGLTVPEAYGGAGYSFVELGIVLEETGRALACVPVFSSIVLAANAVLLGGDEDARLHYLPRLSSGELRATLAIAEDRGQWTQESVTMTAARADDHWILDGHKNFVIDGLSADLLIVAAQTGDGIGLFLIDGDAPGLTRSPLPTLDLTRKQARLELVGAPAQLLGDDTDAWATVSRVLDIAAAAMAAEQVGGAARVVEMAVDYARIRHQFGQSIGSFQAISHACAEMFLSVEAARSTAAYALWSASSGSDELPVVASMAKAVCSDSYFSVAAQNIQIHGAIGFTWEHPAHLYFKRAKSSQLLFGSPASHREDVAVRADIETSAS